MFKEHTLNTTEIIDLIKKNTQIEAKASENSYEASIVIEPKDVFTVTNFLKTSRDLSFKVLSNHTAVHDGDEFKLFWNLLSYEHNLEVTIESSVPVEAAEVPSVCEVWMAADWLERESYDLFGIQYKGHPDLRRIMLPEDWVGHPFRKDYKAPDGYQNIDNSPSEIDKSFKP